MAAEIEIKKAIESIEDEVGESASGENARPRSPAVKGANKTTGTLWGTTPPDVLDFRSAAKIKMMAMAGVSRIQERSHEVMFTDHVANASATKARGVSAYTSMNSHAAAIAASRGGLNPTLATIPHVGGWEPPCLPNAGSMGHGY